MKKMKKLLGIVLTLAVMLSVVTISAVTGEATKASASPVYQVAFDNTQVGWDNVYAYVWNNSSDAMVVAPVSIENGIYNFNIYGSYTNVLFKTEYDKTTWNMQTADQKIPTDGNYCFQPYNGFNKTNGRWYRPSVASDLKIVLGNEKISKGYQYLAVSFENGTAPYTVETKFTNTFGTTYENSRQVDVNSYSDVYPMYHSGEYELVYKVTDANGKTATAVQKYTSPKLEITSVDKTMDTCLVNEKVTFAANVENAWIYKLPASTYWTIKKNGVVVVDNEVSACSYKYDWTPSEAGTYDIEVSTKDSAGDVATYNFTYTVKSVQKNLLKVYYNNSNWSEVYIHYAVNGGNWTSGCGVKMLSSDDPRHTYMFIIDLGDSDGAQVCFNNGKGSWDSKNATNYHLGKGTYGIVYERIYQYSDIVNQ